MWWEKLQNAFLIFKSKLSMLLILQYLKFNISFTLTTDSDSSDFVLGAILSQEEIVLNLPISYAGKFFSNHDINKFVIEK